MMFKFATSLGLLGICFLGSPVLAETLEFGSGDITYAIEQPENWEQKQQQNGIQFTSADKLTSFAISVIAKDSVDVNVSDLQQVLPSKLGLTEATKRERKRLSIIDGKLDGTPMQIQLYDKNDCIISVVLAGSDRAKINATLASMRRVSKSTVVDKQDK